MEVKEVNVSSLIPYERNAKKHPQKQIEQIAESIREFGWAQPLAVDKGGTIVIGHGRYEAAKLLGLETVPCVYVEDLSEEDMRKLRLADNKLNESEWDDDILKLELDDLDFGELDLDWGFDEDPIPLQADEDEYDEAPQEEPVSKRGDVYQLGRHRLVCGDSTDPDDVAKLMDGGAASMLFTSPPYSDMREYSEGMDVSIEKLAQFIGTYEPYTDIQVVNLGIKFRDHEVVRYWDDYIDAADACGYKLMAWNVWDKGNAGSIGAESAFFPLAHEWLFVFAKTRRELNLTVEKKPASIKTRHETRTNRQYDGTMKVMNAGDLSHRFKRMNSVSHIVMEHNNTGRAKEHPARFPVNLPAEYIKALTDEGESVIDCFGGSGTTMIACEQLNRTCYMMEMEPKFVDIIIDRWESFTGEKAVKLND